MSTRRGLGVLLIAGGLIVAACGGGDDDAASAGEDATAQTPTGQEAQEPATDQQQASDAPDDAAQPPAPSRFTITRVDRGTKPDIAIDAQGNPLIAYMLERHGADGWVKVANADGSNVTQVHTGYLYGPLDIEAAPDGRVVVGFHDHEAEDGAVAIFEAGAWSGRTIPHGGHDGWDSAIAFGAAGEILYLGTDPVQFQSADGVELAILAGDQQTVRSLGSGPQPYEWGVDVATAPDGQIRAVFFDAGPQDLIYAVDDGANFTLTPIMTEGDAGRFASLAIDDEGRAHVAFFRAPDSVAEEGPAPGDIIYAVQDGDGWSFEAIGQVPDQVLGHEGARRTVALALHDGQPSVAFIDTQRLTLAQRSPDGVWSTQIVAEADGDPLQVVGLALDAEGAPHLTFSTITANGPLDGEVWYARPS